jgi:glycosyltransferase involved in cell wall biosynthesis
MVEKLMKLSIILPLYNEEKSLEEIVNRVFAVNLGNIDKEEIISNDGPRDKTDQVIQNLHGIFIDISGTGWTNSLCQSFFQSLPRHIHGLIIM